MTGENEAYNIESTFVVFGNDGEATPMAVTETFFEDLYNQFGDFKGHLLISQFSFEADWDSWERHPNGEEFVCLLSGEVELILEIEGVCKTVRLDKSGDYVLIQRGTWHTAKTATPSKMMFITYGEGTDHRPL